MKNHVRTCFFQIYGDGKQTRSFQYVSDLVDGLIKLMNSNYTGPVNLGNPTEHKIEGKKNISKKIIPTQNLKNQTYRICNFN